MSETVLVSDKVLLLYGSWLLPSYPHHGAFVPDCGIADFRLYQQRDKCAYAKRSIYYEQEMNKSSMLGYSLSKVHH